MQSLDTIHDYLRSHSEEIAARIFSSYPALHGADEALLRCFLEWCAFHIQPNLWPSWA